MYENIARYGIILNTENYHDCVSFYKKLFELPQIFEKHEDGFSLTCFEYGCGYLMVEEGGEAKAEKNIAENAFKLRFNVKDLDLALERIQSWGIDAQINENSWGRTINLTDPDGNRIGIRDESGFVKQVKSL